MGRERGGTRTSHPLVPIITTSTNDTESIRMIVDIPEGIRVAYGLEYRRDRITGSDIHSALFRLS